MANQKSGNSNTTSDLSATGLIILGVLGVSVAIALGFTVFGYGAGAVRTNYNYNLYKLCVQARQQDEGSTTARYVHEGCYDDTNGNQYN